VPALGSVTPNWEAHPSQADGCGDRVGFRGCIVQVKKKLTKGAVPLAAATRHTLLNDVSEGKKKIQCGGTGSLSSRRTGPQLLNSRRARREGRLEGDDTGYEKLE
jgi:hypothetical protein